MEKGGAEYGRGRLEGGGEKGEEIGNMGRGEGEMKFRGGKQ